MNSDLPRLFSAIDTVLSLHFASSITIPRLHNLCEKATDLVQKRVDISTFELILAIDPTVYKIVSFGSESYDYGVTLPDSLPIPKFGTILPLRRRQFEERLTDTLPEPVKLSQIAVLLISQTPKSSPTKSSSKKVSKSPTKKSPSKLLRNDLAKFQFREKIASVETSKANGLSLLERIKLKEQLSKGASIETPKMRYDANILSKMPAVYEIIYELASTSTPQGSHEFKSFALPKVISVVKDSFLLDIADTEVNDVIMAIEEKLGHEKIQTLKRGRISAIKVFLLNREHDLQLLS